MESPYSAVVSISLPLHVRLALDEFASSWAAAARMAKLPWFDACKDPLPPQILSQEDQAADAIAHEFLRAFSSKQLFPALYSLARLVGPQTPLGLRQRIAAGFILVGARRAYPPANQPVPPLTTPLLPHPPVDIPPGPGSTVSPFLPQLIEIICSATREAAERAFLWDIVQHGTKIARGMRTTQIESRYSGSKGVASLPPPAAIRESYRRELGKSASSRGGKQQQQQQAQGESAMPVSRSPSAS